MNAPDCGPRRNRRVLIIGLGIAGPTLAWWLAEYGFDVTVVETAQAPRTGGYMIDFWGPGYDVAERMGILPSLRRTGYRLDKIRLVRADGETLAALDADAIVDAADGRFFSLLRADLAGELHRQIRDRVAVRFGDTVTEMTEWRRNMRVAFARAPEASFDLVVDSGGVHSEARRALFPQVDERPLGFWTAAFIADDYPHRDPHAYVSFTQVGRQVARYTLRDGRTAVFFVFRAPMGRQPPRQPSQQKALLRERYAGGGWECREILAALGDCEDLYFDSLTQVAPPRWSGGRLALVGDAAHAPSLLAGQGASLAMAGAYILAGELRASRGDHPAAFRRYEQILRPFVERKQRLARRMGGWFAPRTEFGLQLRNGISQLAALPGLNRMLLAGLVSNELKLPTYSRETWSPAPDRRPSA